MKMLTTILLFSIIVALTSCIGFNILPLPIDTSSSYLVIRKPFLGDKNFTIINADGNPKYFSSPMLKVIDLKTFHNGYYIDSLKNKISCKISYDDEDSFVCIKNDKLQLANANMINGFSFKTNSQDTNIINEYQSVFNINTKTFLRFRSGGKHLKIFDKGYGRSIKYFYCKNDTVLERGKKETTKQWKSRFFSGCPLLAQMAYERGFDELDGNEAPIIFAEYDKWVDAADKQKNDTSMALRGIIDANKYVKTRTVFLRNYFPVRFFGLVGALVFKGLPTDKDIKFYNTTAINNNDYLLAYKARARTRLYKAAINARMIAEFAPIIPFTFIL